MATGESTVTWLRLWARLALGVAALGGDALAEAIERAAGAAPPPVPRRLAAAAGLGLDEEQWRANRELAERFLRAISSRLVVAVLDQVDLDAVADRIDVERILARVDLDAVADRIDVERIVARVDLDAAVRRVDVEGIVRRSTTTMTGESVDALRVQGMNADRLVNGVIDRLLRRPPRRVLADG